MPANLKTHILYTFLLCILFIRCKKDTLQVQDAAKINSNTTDRLNKVLFLDSKTGFAVGGDRFYTSTVLTTHDAGETWSLQNFPEAGKGLYGITVSPDGMVYICGFDGKILYSADSGKNWKFSQLAIYDSYKDLAFTAPGKCVAIGGISFRYGFLAAINTSTVIPSTNTGIQLTRFDTLIYELNDIEMVNEHIGYISGFGVVLKTTDGGNNWAEQDIHNENFTAVYARDDNHVWVCGYNGSIHYTEDGGSTWIKKRNANSFAGKKHMLLDITFTSINNGWAVGEGGSVLYTTDGGDNWSSYDHFADDALRSIVQAPDGNMIVAGDNGTLYKLSAR